MGQNNTLQQKEENKVGEHDHQGSVKKILKNSLQTTQFQDMRQLNYTTLFNSTTDSSVLVAFAHTQFKPFYYPIHFPKGAKITDFKEKQQQSNPIQSNPSKIIRITVKQLGFYFTKYLINQLNPIKKTVTENSRIMGKKSRKTVTEKARIIKKKGKKIQENTSGPVPEH